MAVMAILAQKKDGGKYGLKLSKLHKFGLKLPKLPKIWWKIQKIGGDMSPASLAFRMYGIELSLKTSTAWKTKIGPKWKQTNKFLLPPFKKFRRRP